MRKIMNDLKIFVRKIHFVKFALIVTIFFFPLVKAFFSFQSDFNVGNQNFLKSYQGQNKLKQYEGDLGFRSQSFVSFASSTGTNSRENGKFVPLMKPTGKITTPTKNKRSDQPKQMTRISSSSSIPLNEKKISGASEGTLLPTRIQESKLLPLEQPATFWDKFFVKSFLPPYLRRDTYRYEVSKDVYMFEQIQNFFNVTVNIRMTALRMENGNLFVHAPVAPTKECIKMLKELGGEVEYIVLPVTAIEHKVYMKPFVEQVSRKGFTKIYVAPGQFSFPIDLPLGFQIEDTLDNGKIFPFSKEIDHVGFFYQPFTGYISEVAFFHKKSKTLLLTDGAIYINPNSPPDVVKEQNIQGDLYKKMCLQACFLGPPKIPTFDLISNRLIVSPIVRILVYSRAKKDVKEWIQKVLKWNFTSIIPAHFAAPIIATSKDLEKAYDFLLLEGENEKSNIESKEGFGFLDFFQSIFSLGKDANRSKAEPSVVLPEEDLAILNFLDNFVTETGLAE